MDKYNRKYALFIERNDGQTLKVTLPFTVEFDIHRNSLSSANVAQIRIMNLNEDTRNQIRKDQFDYLNQRQIKFFAGYGDNLSVGFIGNITQAWSVREGVNMVTQIESFDGGFAYVNSVTDSSFPSGTPNSSIIDSITKNLGPAGVSVGSIGQINGTTTRGNAYSGSTTDVLTQLTNGGFFIDNQKVNVLGDDEAIEAPMLLINAKSGLLATPVLEQQYYNIEMLFEPSVRVGQLVKLESLTEKRFNGIHKVLSIKHRGTISEVVSGTATTSLGLLPGVFKTVPQADTP